MTMRRAPRRPAAGQPARRGRALAVRCRAPKAASASTASPVGGARVRGRGRRHHHRRLAAAGRRGHGRERSRCDVSISWATTPCRPWATACACSRRRPKTWPSISAKSRASKGSWRRAPAGFRTRRWNYAAWVMGGLLAVVLGVFAMLKPIALDLQPGDADVKSVGSFSWQSASSVFVFPGEHRLRAEREGYVPAEDHRDGGRSRAGAGAHSPRQTTRQARRWTPAVSPPRFPPMARGSAACPGHGRCAGRRSHAHVQGAALSRSRRASRPSPAAARGSSSRSRSSRRSVWSASARCPRARRSKSTASPPASRRRRWKWTRAFAACRCPSPGLRLWTSSVVVNAGTPQTIGPIELGAADARITVRSVPSGAQVTTGGSFRGLTPVTIDLSPGRVARHHRHARGLRAVDARDVRRSREGIARSTRGSRRCWSKCASRANRPTPRCS